MRLLLALLVLIAVAVQSNAQPPGQIDAQSKMRLLDSAAVALHIQQSEGRRGLVHILQHPPEEGFMLLPADS